MNPIRVYNKFLDLKMETNSYQSLQYPRNYHGVGQFELHINRYMHGADAFQKGDIISLNKQENKTGIILTREIALDENGKESENFKLTGLTMDGIMNRRVSVPPSHTSHDRKTGTAEEVMKHYVYNNFINPTDKSRKLDILEIAPNQNRGEKIEWESRFKVIGEELERISIRSGLGWGVFIDFNTKKLIFDCFQAKNLVQGNEFGYPPVFFSPEFETIKSQSFIDSDQDYKNVGYIGGQGEGVERKIIELGEATGWDRIETFVDARDVGTEDEESEEELTEEEIEKLLIDRGNKKMKEMETVFSLEAEILTPITRKSYVPGEREVKAVTPFEYEKDFDLGDRVQVVNKSWGLTMAAPIIEFLEVHEPGGFRLEGTFGQSRPTIYTKLNDKFNELEGIEKQEVPAVVAVEKMKEAKKFAEEQDKKVKEDAAKDAKDKADQAEKNANDFSKDASNLMEGILDVGTVPIRTAYSGARIEFDGTNGFVQYNKDGNPVQWFDLEGNARFSGDITGATGRFRDVSVKEGDITLEDDTTSTPYSLVPKRNLIKDHSFELVRPDGDSVSQESHNHNWLDVLPSIYPYEDSPWEKSGNPKVSVSFSPDTKDSLAIFGDKAIIVRNANYVRQYVYGNGIGAGSLYTVSGHFKRQWETTGGIPRIEIWHRNNGSREERIVNSTFDAVKDDYSISRHATTFRVPSNFGAQDELEVIISGGNSDWVQCDGVQMVEGDKPSQYQPEDSIWEVTKGNYRPIKETRILWSGERYPTANQTITPSKTLTECINGWVIQWSGYTVGEGAQYRRFHYTYIPKEHAIYDSGESISLRIPYTDATGASQKYLYVYDDHIEGYSGNNSGNSARSAVVRVFEY